MPRQTIYLGAPVEGAILNINGAPRPTWPDVDTNGIFAPFPSARFKGTRALALAAGTDWDLVRVILSGNVEEIVGPGRLLVVPERASILDIQPVISMPATRLYDSKVQQTGTVPQLRHDWKIGRLDGTGVQPANVIYNSSAGNLTFASWMGSAWSTLSAFAGPGHALFSSTAYSIDQSALNKRATDFSPDGYWSFADYVENGALLYDDGSTPMKGLCYVVSSAFGNLGTPGDLTDPTTKHFAFRFGDLSNLFYGRLAVDVFTEDCPDWAPRLPPQRQIVLPSFPVADTGSVSVNQVLMTVPAFNVERICWMLKNGSASGGGSHALYGTIVLPSPSDAVGSLAGVTVVSDGTNAFDIIAANDEGAILYTNVTHPLVKFLMGSSGGASIAPGSIITLVRRVTQ